MKKKLGGFWGCTDRAWIEQVTDPVEFEGIERKWYATTNVPAPRVGESDTDQLSLSTDLLGVLWPVEANQKFGSSLS